MISVSRMPTATIMGNMSLEGSDPNTIIIIVVVVVVVIVLAVIAVVVIVIALKYWKDKKNKQSKCRGKWVCYCALVDCFT